MTEIDEALSAWQPYIDQITDWQKLVKGLEPKPTGCGPVYELGNTMPERAPEEFAIADMRDVLVAEPHYHPNGETEIYVVLSGLGKVVVGGKVHQLEKGSVIVTPPDTTHFTIPTRDLVLAVINVPSFKPENYVPIIETSQELGFDNQQLAEMVEQAYKDRGLVTEHGTDKPGKVYEPHRHEKTHLYTVAGSIVIKLGDQPVQPVKAHQEIIVASNQLHEAVVGRDGWVYIAAWDKDEAKSFEH